MERKILVFATGNAHKVRELKEILGDRYEIRSLKDIGCFDDIPETADTFEGNALQKADYVKNNYGFDCIAEDSGLEVDALDGEPGVFSARYAGLHKNDEDNLQKVLNELGNNLIRTARYHSVIAVIINGHTKIFKGRMEGSILYQKVGTGGFGYDPIFKPLGYEISCAQLTPEQKNAISHRGEAVRKMTEYFQNLEQE